MQDQPTQKEFNQMIMLVALALCFKPGEEYLSEDQIAIRGYAPIENYGKNCIAKLIDSGLVEFKTIEPTFPFGEVGNILWIRRPVDTDQLENFVYERSEQIMALLSQSFDYGLYLHALIQEIYACECIEYAEYYADKASLKIVNLVPSNAKLKLLVMENPTEKVNSLVWRAIKIIAKKLPDETRTVELAAIMNVAFENYVRYKKLNIPIEEYRRPSHFKPSLLSGLLELYRGDII